MKNKKQPKTPAIPDIGKCLETPAIPAIGKYLDTHDAESFSQTAKAFTAIKPEKVILSGNDDLAAWQAKLNKVIHVGLLKIENAKANQLNELISFIDLPYLRRLDLSGCGDVLNDQILHKFLTRPISETTTLQVAESTAAAEAEVVARFPKLTHVNLRGCIELTDVSIKAIAKYCKDLTHLDVSMCNNLTDASITAIAQNCPSFTYLDVSGCSNLTSTSIIEIAKHCTRLTYLSVDSCMNLTDASITAIAQALLILT